MTLADIKSHGQVAKLYWPAENDPSLHYFATLVPAGFVVGLVESGQRGVRASLYWNDEPQDVVTA